MELISANLHIVDIYRRKKWKPDLKQYITADFSPLQFQVYKSCHNSPQIWS